MGFDGLEVIDCVGRSGGLALLWDSNVQVTVLGKDRNFIDVVVILAGFGSWRVTDFYGVPNRDKRCDSWHLLRSLANSSILPWCVLGDFNNLLSPSKKFGGAQYPENLTAGFRSTV